MLLLETFEKAPTDVQDYDITIVDWLAQQGDTSATVTGVATAGITLVSTTISNGIVKIWVAGGKDGQEYTIRVTITTGTPGVRIKSFEVKIRVRN